MELKEFLKGTISQIADTVSELNSCDKMVKLIVNPYNDNNFGMIARNGNSYKQTTLHFKVALTVIDSDSSSGKVGVFTGWLGASASSGTTNQSNSVSSVEFDLDVLLPQG